MSEDLTSPSRLPAASQEPETPLLDAVWRMIEQGWDIESRAYFEEHAPKNGFQHPLCQAVHHMWKRCVKENPAWLRASTTTVQANAQPACGTDETYKAYYEPAASAEKPETPPATIRCWWCHGTPPPVMVSNDEQTIAMCGPCARRVATFLNAASASQERLPQWHPIETAPGLERILLFYPPQRGLPARVHICDEWDVVSPTRTYFKPTHWMELPAPPALLKDHAVPDEV